MATEEEDEEIRTVTLSPWAGTRVVGLIGFAIGLALVLIYLMTGGGQALFHRTVIVRTYMSDGAGLVRTADVELNGIRVGEVKSVSMARSPDTNRAIQVEMKIRRDYLPAIPIDSKTEITADNLLGDKFINITKGTSPRTIEPGAELATHPPTTNFDPGDLLASLKEILTNANQLLSQVEDPATQLGELVQGDDLYAQFLSTVTGMQKTIRKYDNPKSPIAQAVYGQALYQELRQYVLDVDKQIAAVQASPMLASTSQYEAWLAQAKKVHQTVDSFRTAQLMNNSDLYVSWQQTLQRLDDTVSAVSAGPLLTSTQMYESLNGSSRNTREFLKDFRQNPRKYLRLKLF